MKFYLISAIVVLALIYVGVTYNVLVKLSNTVKEAFATMDVYLKKRWDLIPNLVETVKGYAAHEKSTFKEVVELRNASYENMSPEEKLDINNRLTRGISKIIALSEAYPELKANENFRDLSNQLTKVEEDIANSRKYYNGSVKIFNNKVQMFPSNIVASIFKFKERKMFETADTERNNVQVKF